MTKKKKTPRKAATRSEAQNESPVVPAEPVPLVVTAPPFDDGDDADESGDDSIDENDDAVVDPVLGYQSNYVDAGSASTEPGAVPPVDLTGASLESYLASLNDEDLVRFFERLPANSKIASLFKTRGVGVVESKDDDYDDRSLKSYSEASSADTEKKFFECDPKGSAGKGGGKGDGKGSHPKLKEPNFKLPVWSVVSFEEFDKVYGESVATLKLFSKQDDNDFDFDSVVEEVLVDGATKHRWRSAYGKLFFYSYKDLPNNVVKAAKIVRSAVDNGSLRYDKKLAEAAVSVDASSALKGTRKKQANLAEAEEEGHHLDYFIRENEGNDWIREKIEEMKAKEKAELAKLALVAADQRRADNFNADDEDVGGVYDHDHTPGV